MKAKKIVQRTLWLVFIVVVLWGAFFIGYYSGMKHVTTIRFLEPLAAKPIVPISTDDDALQFIPIQLTDQEEKAYKKLQKAIWNMEPSATVHNISYQQLLNFEKLLLQSPELFWLKSPAWFVEQEDGYQLFFEFSMTREERDAALEDIDKVVEDIFSCIAPDNVQDVIKIGCKWLYKNTIYALENGQPSGSLVSQTILGPFLEKEGICSGYAKSLAYLIGKAGYPVGYCIGWYNNTYHAWVAIKNGENIFYIDPTACVTIQASPIPVDDLGPEYTLEFLNWYTPVNFQS